MIHQIEATLRASNSDGRSFSAGEFVKFLSVEPGNLTLVGAGEPGRAALIILWDLTVAAFANEPEPYESFGLALSKAFHAAADFLQGISSENAAMLRNSGIAVDVFVDVWLDQDQFYFSVPPQFGHELVRLKLPLTFNSYH